MFDQADRHIFLYAKGHYHSGDIITDLKILIGKRNALDPKYVTVNDIVTVLLEITLPYVQKSQMRDFIMDLGPDRKFLFYKSDKYSFYESLIHRCLCTLAMTRIIDPDGTVLMDLGKPDSSILPLKSVTDSNCRVLLNRNKEYIQMGYTHYFDHSKVSQITWDEIVSDCKKLYENMPEHSMSSGGFYAEDLLILDGCFYGRDNDINGPIFSSKEIWFNGTDSDYDVNSDDSPNLSHETFVLRRDGESRSFCKTARKPYDLMVQACLLVYCCHSPDTIKLSSDGDKDDWEEAIKFVYNVLGYKINPLKS